MSVFLEGETTLDKAELYSIAEEGINLRRLKWSIKSMLPSIPRQANRNPY
jgi:hypothetical protein